jgi:hypothetical protein
MKQDIKQFVKKFIASHEPDTFIPDKNGNYMYYSENGVSGINLESFFESLLEDFIEDGSQVKEIKDIKLDLEQLNKYNLILQRDKIVLESEIDRLKEVADEMAKELEKFYVNNPEWCESLTKYKQLNTSAE